MVYSALEVLTIIANSVALIICLISNILILLKSIKIKSLGLVADSTDYDLHKNLFELIKSCGRCGFFFQLLAWLMFSARQKGFIELTNLTFIIAVMWAALAILTIVIGIAVNIIKRFNDNALMRKKIVWFVFYSILYFAVSFFIG